MNKIHSYFTSPLKMVLQDHPSIAENCVSSSSDGSAVMNGVSSLAQSSLSATSSLSASPPPPTVVAVGPAAASKLIVSNMESVISSVKKHRKARRKKRESVEPEISDISAILSNSLSFVAAGEASIIQQPPIDVGLDTTIAHLLNSDGVKNETKTPANVSPTKAVLCFEEDNSATKPKQSAASSPAKSSTAEKSLQKNAFEFMMNARNRSIGSNSPGKDSAAADLSIAAASNSANKAKRKLMLEEWANRKGGTKRKANEIESEEFVNRQMKKRAKRLKKLLAAGGDRTKSIDKSPNAASNSRNRSRSNATAVVSVSVASRKQANQNKSSKTDILGKSKCNNTLDPTLAIGGIDILDDVSEVSSSSLNESFIKFDFKKIDKSRCEKPKKSKKRSRVFDSADENDDETSNKPSQRVVRNYKQLAVTVTRKSDVAVTVISPKSSYAPQPKDDDVVPFEQMLSSPTKKRDSLLGYFNKITKTPPSVDHVDVLHIDEPVTASLPQQHTAKRRGPQPALLPSKIREKTPPPQCSSSSNNTPTTANDRPKRSCRDKVTTYKVDLEKSPAKVAAQKSLRRARRLLSSGSLSPQKSPKRKLASIFVKAPTKPSIDPAVSLARQQFLMSGIPECMRADIERQRTYVEIFECDAQVFPTVSHIRQWEEVSVLNAAKTYAVHLRTVTSDNDDPLEAAVQRRFLCGRPIVAISTPKTKWKASTSDRTQITDPDKLVRSLKKGDNTSKFLYFRCYKRLRDKCNKEDDATQKLFYNPNLSDDDSLVIVDDAAELQPNGTLMYTDKFRAVTSDEILVNSAPVEELKKFLATWQENDNLNDRRYSMDEDEDFDMGTSSRSALNKTVVLLGPHGSGKTSAVYALANELHFKVLEINAGTKRTGKKILQELQEATQSHQVKGTGQCGDNRQLFKNLQSGSCEENSSGYGASQHSQTKLSLILIEDADIVFEQDFGFIDAIYQLAATSKRPIILVANQKNCDHLSRFMAHNCIVFKHARIADMSRWLSLLSIAEKQYVGREQCAKLYERNGCDLRRTMLELQFYVQSGGDERPTHANGHHEHEGMYDFFTANQNIIKCDRNGEEVVPFPVDFNAVHDKCGDLLKPDSAIELDDFVRFYDDMSSALLIQSRCVWNDRIVNSLSEEIGHEFVQRTIRQRIQTGEKTIRVQAIREHRSQCTPLRSLLSDRMYVGNGPSINGQGGRAIDLDVEPCLRTICRSEKERTKTERRNSRFYHYLRNAVTNSFSTGVFDRHCDIFGTGD